MEKILNEVLAEDISLLSRGQELSVALEKKVPPKLQREFSAIKFALKFNVGNFFVLDKEDFIGKYRIIKTLVEGGMNESKINFVLKTFSRALLSLNGLDLQLETATINKDDKIFAAEKEKADEDLNIAVGKFIWDSTEPFVKN